MKSDDQLIVIGRTARVDIPELRLKNVFSKIDTGAYRSSLHCEYIEEVVEDGKKVLKFQPIDSNYSIHTWENYSLQEVMSSSGDISLRFCIDLEMVLEGKKIISPVTLSDRAKHKVNVLLGRTFLSGHFLIDTSQYAKPRLRDGKKR